MPTFYLDYENGNDNYSGTSFNVLASGTDGAITSTTFSSASANFPNDNTIAPLKNLVWHTNFWQGYGSYNGCRLLSLNYAYETVVGPTGINAYIYYLPENPSAGNTTHLFRTVAGSITFNNSTQYTISTYIKSINKNKVVFQWTNDTSKSARFNLSNGTVEATGANASATITSAGGGWYRLTMTITSSASASSDLCAVYLVENTFAGLDAANSIYMGDSTTGIYFTGFQIEAGSSATSYENPAGQTLSIFNGTLYAYFHIIERLSSTSLKIANISGGTGMGNTSGRQYYIGGRIKTFTTGLTAVRIASCDTVRVMASPDPTSIGSATWDGTGSQPTINISSSTNASPISITTSSAHGYSTGDTVFICDHTTNTNAVGTWEITVTGLTTFTLDGSTGNGVGGATGTVRKANNCVVRLASPLTENIAAFGNRGNGRTLWTASTNITSQFRTASTREGDVGDQFLIDAAFTTGLAAYKSFSTKDLSGYQQISFGIVQFAGSVASSGQLQLKLCSDTAGAVAVNTFDIPALGTLSAYHVFTLDAGTNLGNNIQSIALYVTSDVGAQTILLSNIIACKAKSSNDSLSLTSLIGKNTTNETWYPILSINGTRVILDGRLGTTPIVSAAGGFPKGYFGTSQTITTYKRETIKTPPQSAAGNGVHLINDNISNFSPNIGIEGGYDTTNMSTQTGLTFFDGSNCLGYGIASSSKQGFSFKKLGFVRYDRVSLTNILFGEFKDCYVIGCFTNGFDLSTASQYCKFENVFCNNNYIGLVGNFGFNKNTFTNCYFLSNNLRGMDLQTYNNNTFNNCYFHNNGSQAVYAANGGGCGNTWNNSEFRNNQAEAYRTQGLSFNDTWNNCITSGNTTNAIYSFGGSIYLNNCLINESSEFGFYGGGNGRIYCYNHDNTPGNYFIAVDFGLIRPQTAVRYSNSGYAWALSPTSDYRKEDYPLDLSVAKIAVNANGLVTIKAWMRRTSVGLSFRLRIKGGQIAGVTNDVISYMTASADIWQQVTLSFTPTEVGVVELLAECWGGTSFTGYIDDLSVTQV